MVFKFRGVRDVLAYRPRGPVVGRLPLFKKESVAKIEEALRSVGKGNISAGFLVGGAVRHIRGEQAGHADVDLVLVSKGRALKGKKPPAGVDVFSFKKQNFTPWVIKRDVSNLIAGKQPLDHWFMVLSGMPVINREKSLELQNRVRKELVSQLGEEGFEKRYHRWEEEMVAQSTRKKGKSPSYFGR